MLNQMTCDVGALTMCAVCNLALQHLFKVGSKTSVIVNLTCLLVLHEPCRILVDSLSGSAMPAPGKRGFGLQSGFSHVICDWQVAQAKWKYEQVQKAYDAQLAAEADAAKAEQRSEGAKAAGKGKSSTKPQGGACFFGHLIYINDIAMTQAMTSVQIELRISNMFQNLNIPGMNISMLSLG